MSKTREMDRSEVRERILNRAYNDHTRTDYSMREFRFDEYKYYVELYKSDGYRVLRNSQGEHIVEKIA